MTVPYWIVITLWVAVLLGGIVVTVLLVVSRRRLQHQLKRAVLPAPEIEGVSRSTYDHEQCTACHNRLGGRVDHGRKRVCPKCGCSVARTADLIAAFRGERRPTIEEIQAWVVRKKGDVKKSTDKDIRNEVKAIRKTVEKELKDTAVTLHKCVDQVAADLQRDLKSTVQKEVVRGLKTSDEAIQSLMITQGNNIDRLDALQEGLSNLQQTVDSSTESNIWAARKINIESDDDISG